jgi:hypothetical protein
MKTFINTGIYTQGCIVPITTEDPSLLVMFDEFSEEFRLNIYCGESYIDSITMADCRQMCNSVSSLPVYSRHNEYLGNVWSLMNEQMYYDYLRIHNGL